jgi:acyl-CoA thioesterase YciA
MNDSPDSLISQPQGELALQTIAMPKDANMNGDIFGGWLVSQMDLAAAVLANKTAKGRVATVAIENMVFIAPVNIGDVVSCYAQLIKIGRSSITMQVSAWSTSYVISDEKTKVADGIFVFVAIDENKRTRPVPQ